MAVELLEFTDSEILERFEDVADEVTRRNLLRTDSFQDALQMMVLAVSRVVWEKQKGGLVERNNL